MDEIEPLAPLDHEEVDDIAFSYAGDLNEGESASAATVGVEVVEGKDPSPGSLRVGNASVNAAESIVVQRVQGRFPDVTYKLRCKITLSPTNRVLIKTALLPVVRR